MATPHSTCVQGFTSWLFWTYDSNDVQPAWYGMVDDNGAIDSVRRGLRAVILLASSLRPC